MTAFVWNILLAVLWVFMAGEVTPTNILAGLVLGYVMLLFSHRVLAPSSYYWKGYHLAKFILFFLWELLKANLKVAYDVATPTHYMRPGVIAIPLDLETDEQITLLANLITLTPGTLALDVSSDKKVLYIHAMYVIHEEAIRREIKEGFENRVLELTR